MNNPGAKARPLPPIPEPPTFGPDERQEGFYREVGRLLKGLCDHDHLELIGLTDWTGYPASCPDLGRLTDLIYDAFHAWSAEELTSRWEEAAVPWLNHLISVWVQRVRRRDIRLLPGPAIELFLMTRDDHGDYSFHVRIDLAAPRRRAA